MNVTSFPGRGLLGALERLVLPATCLSCDRSLGAGRQPLGLCLPCRGKLRSPPDGCPVCGTPLSTVASEGVACSRCRSTPPVFDRLWAAWSYEGPAAAVIAGLKYRRLDYLGDHLAEVMAQGLAQGMVQGMEDGQARTSSDRRADRVSLPWDVVVPVPLHWRRRLSRGFNQAERIARPRARRLGLPFGSLLRRRRATRSQARLGRSARLGNPAGAFVSGRWNRRRPVHALLVDDVATTGATLDAAALALRAAGIARVSAAVAARTPGDSI